MPLKENVVKVKGRIDYPMVFKARSVNGSAPKFSATIILDKDDYDQIEICLKGIQSALDYGKERLGWSDTDIMSKKFRNPLRDGDEDKPGNEVYANASYIQAYSAEDKPVVVVDAQRQPITSPQEIQSGDEVWMVLRFYPFGKNDNLGIAVALLGVQKIRSGERIAPRTEMGAEDMFDVLNEE